MTRTTLLIVLLILPLTGCLYSREIVHTRRDIERATRVDFDRGVVLSLGPASLRTLRWLVDLVPEDEAQMGADYLREIRRVKVGVYHTERGALPEVPDVPRLRRFERDDWEVAVRFSDEDGSGWVLYRERRSTVRDLYVVLLTDEELVLARVEGRLNHLLARVMEDHAEMAHRIREEL